jgi:hypothetical protein
MLDEGNNDFNLEPPAPETPEGPESSNRTFLIVGGILAAIVLLTLVCFAILLARSGKLFAPSASAKSTQTAIAVANAAQAQQGTATALAALFTATPLPSPLPSVTSTVIVLASPTAPSPTPVVAQPSNTPVIADAALTATMGALQTAVAGNLTQTATQLSTVMPKTGFADEVGLPGLVILAVVLVAVIFLARRLRSSPAH